MGEFIQAEYQLFINRKGQCLLGPGKTELLSEIKRTGSLRAASKKLKISYQHAWTVIDTINQASYEPVVLKQRGGTGGGGAMLTSYGEHLLSDYQAINKEVQKFFKKLNMELNL
jgi:molybdate transport system regulatory protein